MSIAFLHVITQLPHFWHVSGGPHGWWAWREWPFNAAHAARTYGMAGFGQVRGHVVTAEQWR